MESFVDGYMVLIVLLKVNVLKYYLNDGIWIVIWLFGMELKIKFYIGMLGSMLEEVNDKLVKFEDVI